MRCPRPCLVVSLKELTGGALNFFSGRGVRPGFPNTVKSPSVTQRSVSQENAYKKS